MGDSKIRNICILAHVDHGKTTLADHLIAACGGGVLHPKLAGRLRYMDYLDEEQRRAITMKSSSIALHYLDYNINLIDSPGHMDFCSEVSTAARLSDGALVLVDAVEGVHIQTHAVLRQAWVERLTPCLVLNKIDRLITELKLSPMEAYNRLQRIVHEVNAIVSAYKSEKYLSDVDSLLAGASGDADLDVAEVEDDEEVMFQPQKGNVAFVCALDGWGFRLSHFAQIYASKLGASTVALLKGLWGPRYYHPKKMMIVGKKMIEGVSKDPQPMFVQYVLKPLWQVYQAALEADGDKKMLDKVISTFNLSVPQRELQNKDPKVVLQAVMSRWLPLSDSILSMVVNCMPDPISAQSTRISRLLPKRELALDDASCESEIFRETEYVRKCIESCDSSAAAPCVAFVSKMFAVPFKMLPQKGPNGELLNNYPTGEPGESDECFLAFARIFSGVLHAKQKVFVLSAVYDPMRGESMQRHVQEAELQSLYLMMGQGLIPVSSATAGNLVAIQGLGQYILKSATLSSTKNCWPFSSMIFQVAPTLRVAIEPSNPADMGALLKGLRLLNRADPFVEITVSSRGEQVLAAAGEVHLERCIKDLKERFAKVNLEVSPPLVSFKETIEGEGIDLLEHSKALSCSTEYVEKTTPNGRCVIRVQVLKLPRTLTKVLEECRGILEDIFDGQSRNRDGSFRPHPAEDDDEPVAGVRKRIVEAIESELELISKRVDKDKVERCRTMWYHFLGRMWSFGPSQVGPNILLVPDPKADNIASFNQGQRGMLIRGSCDMSRRLQFSCNGPETDSIPSSIEEPSEEFESLRLEGESLKSRIVSGFQLATAAGPLCDEPMWGLAFLVEPYIFLESSDGSNQSDQYGILSGQVMTAVKEACRTAVLQNKPRLVEAMYFCELNTPTEYLGAMYGVLGKMRARVLKEEMQEGSSLFTVHAYVPVAESFGFADELRKRTSGAASALLVLSHWEELSEDPFFVPKTEEEIEEFGDGSSVLPNMARKLMNSVRRRKGLHVEEKVVQHATKQRTLARKV